MRGRERPVVWDGDAGGWSGVCGAVAEGGDDADGGVGCGWRRRRRII